MKITTPLTDRRALSFAFQNEFNVYPSVVIIDKESVQKRGTPKELEKWAI